MAGPSSRRPSVAAGPSSLPPPSPRDPLQPQPRGCNNNARPTPPPPLTQPTTVKLSPAGLRMFLHRITHPPSPPPSLDGHATKKGKERAKWWSGWSLAIQPEYDVKLEDVLDRKHLPPLGLKDFEEWLVYVEGTPENLYFILWLREYEHRYDAWKSSLRSKHDLTLRSTSSHPSPITTSLNPPSVVVSSQRERAFASLGMAMSSLSLSPPSPHRSPAPYPSYPTFSSPRSPNPNVPTTVDDDIPDVELSRRRSIGYRTLYTPTPNAELATFYLRAKETFLTPAAEYELVDVSSDVLSIFHVPSSTSDRKGRRDSGIAFQSTSEWDRERAGEKLSRYGSRTTRDDGIAGGLVPVHSERLGLAGSNANAYPPDPAVFDELAEIVKDRLRASLKRLVFATYNNVGMPRAYCGSAGGCMIALVTSAPPIIASFAAGGPRWWRLLALPGLWLGMTIFISAMYGVCMMIYVFGDLRQLRSFELARPPPGADSTKPITNPNTNNANTKTKSVESHAPSALSAAPPSPISPERRSSVFTLRHGMMSRHNKSEDRLSPGALSHRSQADLPFRKDSLVPVPNPFPLLPMPSRPRPAYTIGGTSVRSKSRTPPESPTEENSRGGSGSPREKPQLRLDIWGSGMGVQEGGSGSGGVQVPPRAVTRERVGEEVGPTVVVSSEDEGSVGEHSQYDDEYDDDEDDDGDGESDGYADDSGFEDTELDEDYDEGSSPYAFNSSRGGHEHRHRHRRRHTRPPPIEISGPYYDTDPSPEGPATAPADFMPYNLERLAARNPIPDVSTAHSDNPLWPDYSYQAQQREEEYERRKQETATFIGGFAYDGGESVSEWGRRSVSVDSPGSAKDKEEKSVYAYADAGDVEKGKGKGKGRMSAEEEVRQTQAAQRMGPFDFDELPVRKMKPSLRLDVPVKGSAPTSGSPVVQETSRGTAAMSISGGGIGGGGQGGVDVRKMKEEKAERLREQRRLEANTKGSVRSTSSRRSPSPGSSVSTSSNGKPQRWYWVFVEWMQVKCGPKNILDVIDEREGKEEGGKGKGKTRAHGNGVSPARAVMEQARVHAETQVAPSPVCSSVGVAEVVATVTDGEREARRRARPSWRERLRKVYLAVPAFAAPLTPVLNPLVGRAQWEIVVRSAAASAVLSCVIVGGLLGAPET